MINWITRLGQLAVLGERLAVTIDSLARLSSRVDDHERRLVRVETIIEIARPDGMTLRIGPPRAEG